MQKSVPWQINLNCQPMTLILKIKRWKNFSYYLSSYNLLPLSISSISFPALNCPLYTSLWILYTHLNTASWSLRVLSCPTVWLLFMEQSSCSISSVQSLSHVWLFVTPLTVARQASLSITNSRSLLKLMSMASVMPSNHLIFCHPLLLSPSILPSIRVFSSESVLCIRWTKYWSFSFSISSSNEYSELISFRMDWLDLLAVQGTLKSLLQHHSSKASVLCCSAFFIVQLSHPYRTTGKTIALTRQTVVGKVMSLLFNTLSRFHSNSKNRQCQRMFKLPHNCIQLTH